MHPETQLLHRVGEALYGPRWQSEMARALKINARTVQRWAIGDGAPRLAHWVEIEGLLAAHAVELANLRQAIQGIDGFKQD
jgi:hypothetical protein